MFSVKIVEILPPVQECAHIYKGNEVKMSSLDQALIQNDIVFLKRGDLNTETDIAGEDSCEDTQGEDGNVIGVISCIIKR